MYGLGLRFDKDTLRLDEDIQIHFVRGIVKVVITYTGDSTEPSLVSHCVTTVSNYRSEAEDS